MIKNKEFERGVRAAADIANHYNSSTIHPYMLGDCIMKKLNSLPKGKRVRRNRDRIYHAGGRFDGR